MAIEVLPNENKEFIGTEVDEFANSTSADEKFTMGSGANIINFDLSNNNLVGTDEIYLTEGENLILNFKSQINYGSFNTYNQFITWERVTNDNDGIDLVIKTCSCKTYGYAKIVTTITDEIAYQSSYYTYYKSNTDYYLYDYEHNEWVLNKTVQGSATSNQTQYGQCYVNLKDGVISSLVNYYGSSSDEHENYAETNGVASGELETDNIINTITIKDVGAKQANSVKIQYTNPDDASIKTYQEYVNGKYQDVDFITRSYTVGEKDSTEDQILQGSFLDETFWTGKGSDTINAVGGNNEIYLYNSAKDVTLGEGVDFVHGDFSEYSTDYYHQSYYACLDTDTVADGITIRNGDSADTLKLYDYGTNDFYKDGDNLVIIQNWQYNTNGTRLSKFTVEDYFTAESRISLKAGYIENYNYYYNCDYALKDENTMTVTYNTSDPQTKDIEIQHIVQGSGEVNGTENSEAIVATGLATITTGNGNDIIYTSSADDTITINGSGDKTIVLDSNSGDDTIDIQNHEGKILLYMPNGKEYNDYWGYNFYKDKSGDSKDLIIERYNQVYVNNNYEYIPQGKTVIKNYFNFTTEQTSKIYLKTMNRERAIAIRNLIVDGDEGKENVIYGSDLNDTITGKELSDTIYTGKGEDNITPNQGDDLIEINDDGYKTINIARTDGSDTVHLSGDALKTHSFNLKYTDGFTGLSHQIQDGNLVLYTTTVDGDNITTQNTTITGITGSSEITTENIANYNGGLNISGKTNVYNNNNNGNSEWLEFKANTPIYIEGNKTEANNINATNKSNLVTGGSADDTITATGEINHVYTSAGKDTINVNSTVQSVVYAGSGDDEINVTGGTNDYIYAEDGNDTINLISGDATIDAGAGDDTITVNSGTAEIHFGTGQDKAYIKGGTGGTLCFTASEGDKHVYFQNASDAMYSIALSGSYYHRYFYKDGDDFIIETQYNHNYDTEEHDVEHYYLHNFFNPEHSKVDPSSTRIKVGVNSYSLKSYDLIIVGQDDPDSDGKIYNGTYCWDKITGTDYADKITTGTNNDEITPGKGDDFITVAGDGKKAIILSKGDGNDTVHINEDVVFSEYHDDYDPGVRLYNKDSYDDSVEKPENYSYSIDENKDLIIYRTYKNNGDALTESVKITGIRALDQEHPAEITIENIINKSGGLNVSDKIEAGTPWENVYEMHLGKEDQSNELTTTEGTKNTVIGGALKDTITSQGSDDYINAGAGDDTITTSATKATIYGGDGKDTITSNSNNATIYADAGDDEIIINGGTVNINFGKGSDTAKINGGQGTINLSEGCGNNTVIFEKPDVDGTYNINLEGITIYGSYSLQSYTSKSGDDLVIYRDASKKDTITIKGLFGDNQLSDGNKLTINGYNLASMNIAGVYDKEKGVTVFAGSNYGDQIYGTDGKDIITTGAGNDEIYPYGGDNIIKITGGGTKQIYNYNSRGNDTIEIPEGTDVNYSLYFSSYSNTKSHTIDGNDLILNRTYTNGDDVITESTRIKGIKATDKDNPAAVTYDNIANSDGGLNISGKISGLSNYSRTSVQGKTNKANKLTTSEGTSNVVTGGNKKDTVLLNGNSDYVYTGKGSDNITVDTSSGTSYVYSGSGNDKITVTKGSTNVFAADGKDTIILNTNGSVTAYTGKGNDTIYANGSGSYSIYSSKGDGNDTIKIGKDFDGYVYARYNDSPEKRSHSIDKNGNLTLYRTYSNGSTVTTESTKITGINGKDDDGKKIAVTYDNIANYSGGLNVSGKTNISNYSSNMIIGSSKLTSKEGINNVIVGGNAKETITLNGYNDYLFAGAGADNITVNSTNSTIYTGEGNDQITINKGSGSIYIYAGGGNDTIMFNGTDFGTYTVYFYGYNSYNDYCKSGDDLLVRCTYRNSKNKTLTETHTIKDYFKNADTLGTKLRFNYDSSAYYISSGISLTGKYDGKQKATIFDGTQYRDIVVGTNKKDIITTGNEYDRITPDKGDDTVEINGSGYKYIYINNGDGNDTVKWTENVDTTSIAVINTNKDNIISYEKSGTNLVITRTFESGKTLKSETVTIEGYYDSDGNVVESVAEKLYINGTKVNPAISYNRVDYATNTINVETDYEFATGTKGADTITTTADNSAIFAGEGNDTINVNGGNAIVTSGYGTDTINVNTTGKVTVNHTVGDGNDTVTFGDNTPSALSLNIDSPMFKEYNDYVNQYMYLSGKHGLIQSGDDLIYSVPVSSAINAKTETITFKDYFAEGVNKPEYISLNLSDYDYHMGSIESLASSSGIWVEGHEKDGVTTYNGMEDYTNRYEYNGSGKTIINGANRADYYNVSINSKSNLYINDSGNESGSGYDTLCINTDYKNLRALFNMSASGQVIVSDNNALSDNFFILEKGSLNYSNVKNIFSGKDGKGVINIDNFFSTSTSYATNGTGVIENVYAAKNILKQCYNSRLENNNNVQQLTMSYWLEDLGQKVASWLTANTDGTKTTFEIFETGTKDEVNALLKVYNTVYDKNFSS